MDQNASRTDHADRIARTIRHIDAHQDGDLGLDALAEVAALSRFHFSRVFRAQTGEGVAEAVRRIRLNRAALMVAYTAEPMTVIARRCGFGHVGSFERAFAAAFGGTPRQLRARRHLPPPLLPPVKGDFAMFPSEIRTAPDTTLAGVAHRGPYQEIGTAFERLMQTLDKAGLWKTSGPSFGIYYDDPSETPVAELRAHAAQKLAEGDKVPESLDRIDLPGGRFLVVTCKGPFSKLPEAWAFTYARALPESGCDFRDGIPFKRYVSNSWETKPEDRITEIWVPVV